MHSNATKKQEDVSEWHLTKYVLSPASKDPKKIEKFILTILQGEKRNKEQNDKLAEMRQRKKEKLLALVGNKAPTMGQVNCIIFPSYFTV